MLQSLFFRARLRAAGAVRDLLQRVCAALVPQHAQAFPFDPPFARVHATCETGHHLFDALRKNPEFLRLVTGQRIAVPETPQVVRMIVPQVRELALLRVQLTLRGGERLRGDTLLGAGESGDTVDALGLLHGARS